MPNIETFGEKFWLSVGSDKRIIIITPTNSFRCLGKSSSRHYCLYYWSFRYSFPTLRLGNQLIVILNDGDGFENQVNKPERPFSSIPVSHSLHYKRYLSSPWIDLVPAESADFISRECSRNYFFPSTPPRNQLAKNIHLK